MGKSPSVGRAGFYMRARSAFGYHSRWHGRPRRHQGPLPRSLPSPSGSTRHGKSTCDPADVPTQFFRFLARRPARCSFFRTTIVVVEEEEDLYSGDLTQFRESRVYFAFA